MEFILKAVTYTLNVILFVLFSIIFLPALLIVTYGQETWSGMLKNLFDF